jgi:hypothetical protein
MFKILPEPDYMDLQLSDGYISLVTDDGTAATPLLVEMLVQRGLRPVVLTFPASVVSGQQHCPLVSRVTLSDMSEDHLQHQLAQIASTWKASHCHSYEPGELRCRSNQPETQKAIVKSVFLLAKHLKETLTGAARQGRAAFLTVARLDGEFGLGKNADFEPVSGGLFGLVKSLNLEWEAVFCRGIDLSPELDAEQSAARILAELYDPNRLVTEVAYTARTPHHVDRCGRSEVG